MAAVDAYMFCLLHDTIDIVHDLQNNNHFPRRFSFTSFNFSLTISNFLLNLVFFLAGPKLFGYGIPAPLNNQQPLKLSGAHLFGYLGGNFDQTSQESGQCRSTLRMTFIVFPLTHPCAYGKVFLASHIFQHMTVAKQQAPRDPC